MCRIMHTVSEGSGGLLREAADYSGGFLVWSGGRGGEVIAAHPLPCLNAAPLSGESVVLPVKVTPKTHNSQTQEAGSLQEAVSPSVTRQSSREETVWHTIGVIMTNKKRKEKVNSCVFFVFFSTS